MSVWKVVCVRSVEQETEVIVVAGTRHEALVKAESYARSADGIKRLEWYDGDPDPAFGDSAEETTEWLPEDADVKGEPPTGEKEAR